ncbi:hypothetical protein AC578_8926 [Pseudocercospora eumusae]|uniref:RRM domain-containing protein n=1 Tax=Pseudocercospora eumusae TaxID=321146 RepID=A0A139HMY5_9PEZI|nr:hypothetical protein AC578_8926 [Pseudocercospora eumusae]KXT03834.1 hypothetical protein AC578_8926 [Pseudocercospora eumusae]
MASKPLAPGLRTCGLHQPLERTDSSTHCPHCNKPYNNELPPLDRSWSPQPTDSDSAWPIPSMQGLGNAYGGSGHFIYDTPEEAGVNSATADDATPRLPHKNAEGAYLSGLGFPTPGAHLSSFDHGNYDSSSSTMNSAASGGGGGGFGRQKHAFNPMAAERHFNVTTRHQVPQRSANEPIARPESSLSNGTFATQPPADYVWQDRPQSQFNGRSMYEPYNGHGQTYSNTMASSIGQFFPPQQDGASMHIGASPYNTSSYTTLGAGMANMKIGEADLMPSSRALTTINDHGYLYGDRNSDQSRNDSLVSARYGPSAFSLAQDIKMGRAEDPFDRALSRLDTPSKLPNPTLGPARFKDSKMFSTADEIDARSMGSSNGSTPRLAIMPAPKASHPPDWLQLALEGNMSPTIEEAFDALPLIELCRMVHPSMAGVVRVKDIPYGTTRQEMIAFVGRNAQILRQPEGAPYHAVHILMERESGKTMDCFIEVSTPNEAAWVVSQFAKRAERRRPPKVGDRLVEVLYSSQDELMAELFPRAKHVRWSHGQPVVDKTSRNYYAGQKASGFQGFLHSEELVAMTKHALLSERSPFASKSPCRVYEAMITLLYKYPWYDTEHITISERRAIYDCAIGLAKTLINELRRGTNKPTPLQPTSALLQELAVAMLSCPGFTEKQKAAIVSQLYQGNYQSMADGRGVNVQLGGRHEFSFVWPFSALSMLPDADPRLMRYYAGLFRQATSKPTLAERQAAKAAGYEEKPMGNIKVNYGDNAKDLSLAEVAKMEYDEIETMLGRVLARAPPFVHGFSAPVTRRNSGGPGSSSSSSLSGGSIRSAPFM